MGKEDLEEIIEIESLIDIMLPCLNKYEEVTEVHKYFVHIKTRFLKYQVRHRQLTGEYYHIDRDR